MKLLIRLNLVVAGLTAAFAIVLIAAQIQSARASVREEIAAANRVASQLLQPLASVYSRDGGPTMLLQFLQQLGRVRANDITLESAAGEVFYRSPPATYKAGREAPAWFAQLLAPTPVTQTFPLPGGVRLVMAANSSRAVLDAWDDVTRLLLAAAIMLIMVNGIAIWSVARALKPFPVIAAGLERLQRGDLAFRLPLLTGFEARMIGGAFNRMAQAVEDKVHVERKAREAETRLEEGRDMAHLIEQRIEEERRLIAHELHDEFGQSVTAIRSLAVAIATQAGARDPATAEVAGLISTEAARLYDAMHGLIPRLMPLSLDTLGLAATLDSLVRDWQRRYPVTLLSVRHALAADLGPSVTLVIYRVVQEGLINALRHAQASQIDITVDCDAHRILVSVSDDGAGLSAQWSRSGHFGLRGLADRVERLGGALHIGNQEPRGVCLRVDIPLPGPLSVQP
jgi:two-component system sensor histidine kinase UhpB